MSILKFHPVFVERPVSGRLTIKWYAVNGGKCNGRDFYEQNPKSKPSLRAQAQVLASKGHLRSDAGHYCEPPFEKVFEFTPKRFRFFAFRSGDVFYITNGAWKNPKNQDKDRRFCEKCRIEYLSK